MQNDAFAFYGLTPYEKRAKFDVIPKNENGENAYTLLPVGNIHAMPLVVGGLSEFIFEPVTEATNQDVEAQPD